MVDMSAEDNGAYCFIFNPTEDGGDENIRLTRNFTLDNDEEPPTPTTPQSRDDCKNGGWMDLEDENGDPFRNQGQCVSWFNHNN
jgi:hypothetical protein